MELRGAGQSRARVLFVRACATLALTLAAWASATAVASAGETGTTTSRYSLVHGCFGVKPAGGDFLVQSGDGYTATGAAVGDAEPFRMQATELGQYLFYGQAQDFLALDSGPLAGDEAIAGMEPSPRADWTVDGENGRFTIVNEAQNQALGMDGDQLVAVPVGQAATFVFAPAEGCATYPEIELNTSGDPGIGSPRYGEVRGTIDGHMHMMAFEFLGRQAHCGQPWHRYGAEYALQDCADHEPNGCSAALETGLGGDPCHNTDGWPTFAGWPKPESLTHESSYYRWLERAYQGGLRIFVNLYVENRALCRVYPDMPLSDKEKSNCNEMDTVLREYDRLHELQDYIDAQEGGPGEGWFRIVETPFQARKVINKGKLAVIQGMEVSEPFNCGMRGGPIGALETPPETLPPQTVDPRCTKAGIEQWLDDLEDLGVRQLEITNKFDNGLTGVAGDGGSTGVVVNGGQFLTGGSFWDFGTCEDPHNHDRVPATGGTVSQDEIFGNLLEAFGGPAGLPTILPTFGPGEECNERGLENGDDGETDLGSYALDEIMERRMIFDPDHMSVLGRNEALDQVEEANYPGMMSSHSWSTNNALPRIYNLGGMITPYAGSSTTFVHEYEHLTSPEVREALGDQYFGMGYGADANGFGSQGAARNPGADTAVTYPFESFDGSVTIDQQYSGPDDGSGKTYDINTDGVAHYGLYPDWVEDLRKIAGDGIVRDMNRGAEAYLQMWERTYGIQEVDCSQWGDEDFNPKGLGTELRLNKKPKRTLRTAGQPVDRQKTWRWCANDGGRDSEDNVWAAFSDRRNKMDFALSNLSQHEAEGVGPGDSKRALKRAGTKISKKVWISRTGGKRAYVWVTKGRKVTHAGAVSQSVSRNLGSLADRLERIAAG